MSISADPGIFIVALMVFTTIWIRGRRICPIFRSVAVITTADTSPPAPNLHRPAKGGHTGVPSIF